MANALSSIPPAAKIWVIYNPQTGVVYDRAGFFFSYKAARDYAGPPTPNRDVWCYTREAKR